MSDLTIDDDPAQKLQDSIILGAQIIVLQQAIEELAKRKDVPVIASNVPKIQEVVENLSKLHSRLFPQEW